MKHLIAALAFPLLLAAQCALAQSLEYVGTRYTPHYTIHHGESTPPLQMRVTDGNGHPVANATVRFTVNGNCGGSFAGATTYDATSGADGIASTIPFNAGTGTGWCYVLPTLPGVHFDVPLVIAVAVYEVSDLSVASTSDARIYPHVNSTFTVSAWVVFQGAPFLGYPAQWSVVPAASGASATLISHSNPGGGDIAFFSTNGIGGDYKLVASVGDSAVEIPVSQRGDPATLVYPTDLAIPPSSHGAYAGYVLDQFGLGIRGLNVTARWSCDSSTCGEAEASKTDFDGRFIVNLGSNGVPGDFQIDNYLKSSDPHRITTVHVDPDASPPPAIPVPSVQTMWWGGPAQNGWGISVVQHGDKLFAVIYAYDENGNPTWYVMPSGSWNDAKSMYSGTMYRPSGSPFYAYDASRLVPNYFATGTIAFDDPGVSTDGGYAFRHLMRQPFGTTAPAPLTGLGDMWWGGPSQNGWGVAILQDHANLFCVWFTYDANGAPTWFVMPAGSWTSSDTYEGRMYRTTGSPWSGLIYQPSKLKVFDVGPFKLKFSGDTATFDYTVDARTGTLQLQREAF